MRQWCATRDNNIASAIEFIDWGDELSVYNPFTGETHILNAFPAEILRLVIKTSPVESELSQQMADLCDEEVSDIWQENIVNILQQLENLELIEQY